VTAPGPGVQVTFDAAEPRRLGQFWAEVLGYIEQPPPPGFDDWDAALDAMGVPADQRDIRYAIVDPGQQRPRLLFQKVPEPKTAKNRMHFDVNVGAGLAGDERHAAARRRADDLIALGATEVRTQSEFGESWIVMQDPEGNEFCLQ
jgi:hypothetical protein